SAGSRVGRDLPGRIWRWAPRSPLEPELRRARAVVEMAFAGRRRFGGRNARRRSRFIGGWGVFGLRRFGSSRGFLLRCFALPALLGVLVALGRSTLAAPARRASSLSPMLACALALGGALSTGADRSIPSASL